MLFALFPELIKGSLLLQTSFSFTLVHFDASFLMTNVTVLLQEGGQKGERTALESPPPHAKKPR